MQLIGWYVDGIQPDSCQSILLLFSYDYNNKYILLQLYLILRMSDMFLHCTLLDSLSLKSFLYVSYLNTCPFATYFDKSYYLCVPCQLLSSDLSILHQNE